MIYLRQSTASQSVLLGPFVDENNGKTAEDGLTIANTDIRLSANGGDMAAKNSGGGTIDENGWYTITLDATDTATVGRLQISAHVSGALPVFLECHVLEEAVYDALFAASAPGFATVAALSTAQADLDTLTGTDGATLATSQPNYAPATAAALSTHDGKLDTAQADLDILTGTDGATLATTQANYAPSTHSAADVWAVGTRTLTSFGTLVADIWAALTSGLVTVGSIGKLLVDNVDAAVSSRSSHSAADVWTAGSRELSTPNNYKADVSGLATSAALATAQTDLDTLTGADGATLATLQPNYAPATAAALSAHDGKLDTVDANVDAILLDTGTDGVVIADDAITAAKFDETTAFPLKSADAAATQIARVGADGDTLETLSDQIDGITPSDPAAIVAALLADTSITAAGDVALSTILEDIHSGITGKWTATINGDSTVTLAYFDNDSPAVEQFSFTIAADGLSGTPT